MKLYKNLLKTAVAGAVIFAIGGVILVTQPSSDAPVAEASADITGFLFAPESNQQRFANVLMKEGLEEPRMYNHNGNTLFFSTTTTRESPKQVLERFQRAFVDEGINKKVHLEAARVRETVPTYEDLKASQDLLDREFGMATTDLGYWEDFMTGMVPSVVLDRHMIMMGTTTKSGATDPVEFVRDAVNIQKSANGTFDLTSTQTAMRYLEAFVEGEGQDAHTRIIGIWSDEKYEAAKLMDVGEDLNVDPDVPMCTGCRRLSHFDGKTEAAYGNHSIDAGHLSVDQVTAFYESTLTGRGWELSETAAVLEAAEQQGLKERDGSKLLQFERRGEVLTLVAWPDEMHGTGVQIARSN